MPDHTTSPAVVDEPALFDMTPLPARQPDPVVKLSPDRRRTLRHATAIAAGVHPLALLFGPSVRMHPDASRAATRTDARNLPLRCGSCWYRQLVHGGHKGVFPKCVVGAEARTDQTRRWQSMAPPRVTGSGASDVRAWWPACEDYSSADPAVSDDAARYIPEVAVGG